MQSEADEKTYIVCAVAFTKMRRTSPGIQDCLPNGSGTTRVPIAHFPVELAPRCGTTKVPIAHFLAPLTWQSGFAF